MALSNVQRLHDEAYWPENITNIEKEERRRLFWSMYTLDVYSSVVWNGPFHCQEAHAKVRYPVELDDELIAPDASPMDGGKTCWLQGWNFTTDLYRVLEQATTRARKRRQPSNGMFAMRQLFGQDLYSGDSILQNIMDIYHLLPAIFREISPVTGDRQKDIFGFQAANIQATLALLRMVFFSIEENQNVERKCDVANELLSVFHSVPAAYLRAISTPLIYHLGSIGQILGSVMEGLLSENSYQQVRMMLLSMADLLERLESGLERAAGASRDLRKQVDKIEEYMRTQRLILDTLDMPRNVATNEGLQTLDSVVTDGFESGVPQFQLPPELLVEWMWPLDLTQDYPLFPANEFTQ
ncbi:hypothetical protein LTR28_010826 [Elasticomyces elasticus]|nr:hypothetical protein LTR28_010826 [Elasticomyces elasticus]